MGTRYTFKCNKCGYDVESSGDYDCGMITEMRPYICNEICIERKCVKWRKTKKLGEVRDHGTAIRTKRSAIHEVFEVEDLFSK